MNNLGIDSFAQLGNSLLGAIVRGQCAVGVVVAKSQAIGKVPRLELAAEARSRRAAVRADAKASGEISRLTWSLFGYTPPPLTTKHTREYLVVCSCSRFNSSGI